MDDARTSRPTRTRGLLCLLLAGCAGPPPAAPGATDPSAPSAPPPIDRAEAETVLAAQAALWNVGDLPGFVGTYWDGPELTFLGARGLTRGRADLLAQYEKGYPTAEARGRLSFQVLEFRPLGDDHALLLGRFQLQRAEPADGYFSLVLARQDDRVVILHDHSTAAP